MNRLTFAALVVASLPMSALAQSPPAGPPTIVVMGEATVKRAPDRAWIVVSIETRDPKGADARRKNAEAMTAAQGALKTAGVKPDAIRTIGYSLAPEMDWNNGRSTLRGYVVRNQIEVRVDDLTTLSDVIDAVNASRDAALTTSGPRFGLKDAQAAENEALQMAVQSALARAQVMATGARRSIGPIVRIEERNVGSDFPQPIMQPMALRAAAGPPPPTPITPGEIEVHAQVLLTVELR